MKSTYSYIVILLIFLVGCQSVTVHNDPASISDDIIAFAQDQMKVTLEEMESINRNVSEENWFLPRSVRADTLFYVPSEDWTSGFFAGNLWYMYELTGDNFWKQKAENYTWAVEKEKYNVSTHDVGFIIHNSFGNAYRITKDSAYKKVGLQAAESLVKRYDPQVGLIKSWDFNSHIWSYPVIMDNMLNLELLFWATKESGDSTYYHIAVSHADNTLKNHFREDFSSYHVVDYDAETGMPRNKFTFQGYADDSSWARGQGWGLYGFTMCYRETGDEKYLVNAQKIAEYILSYPEMPDDMIPYWDYKTAGNADSPRDVSAAAVVSSALFELQKYVPEKSGYYLDRANRILENIYNNHKVEIGTHSGFLLDNSTGNLPYGYEVNTPIVYGDYYFLEALTRKVALSSLAK